MPESGDSTKSTGASASPLMLEIVSDSGDWSGFGLIEPRIEAAGRALAAHPRFRLLALSEACVALSDDASVRKLNAAYRAKDTPTNVLSFPVATGRPPRPGERRSLGDVVLAAETVLREAREQHIEPAQHLQHLVVHGLLHLLGYDHESDADAHEMETLEIEILAAIGIENPYAGPAAAAVNAAKDH